MMTVLLQMLQSVLKYLTQNVAQINASVKLAFTELLVQQRVLKELYQLLFTDTICFNIMSIISIFKI